MSGIVEHDLDTESPSIMTQDPVRTQGQANADEDSALGVGTIIYSLLASRYAVVLCLILGVAAGFVFGATKPNLYVAEGRLMVSAGVRENSTAERALVGTGEGTRFGGVDTLSLELELLRNPVIYAAIVQRVGVDRLIRIPDPRRMDTPQTFAPVRYLHEFQAYWFGVDRQMAATSAGLDIPASALEEIVERSLSIIPVHGTGVINVQSTYSDPEVAAQIVDAYLQVAEEHHRRVFTSTGTVDVLSKQLKEERDRVGKLSEELNSLCDEHQVLDAEDPTAATITELKRVQAALTADEERLVGLEKRRDFQLAQMKAILDEQKKAGVALPNPDFRAIEQQVYSLMRDVAGLRPNPGEKQSDFESRRSILEEGLKGLRTRLSQTPRTLPYTDPRYQAFRRGLDEAKSQIVELESSVALYRTSKAQLEKRLEAIRKVTPKIQNLHSGLKAVLQRIAELSRQHDRYRLMSSLDDQKLSNLKIIQRPKVPEDKFGPTRSKFILLGGVAGLAFGLCFSLFRVIVNPRVLRASVLARLTQARVLGVTQEVGRRKPADLIAGARDGKAPYARILDHLWWELVAEGESGARRRIGVVSSAQGVGCTTTAACVAIGLATRTKRKVLLIEADLHNPGLETALKLEQGPGVLDALSAEVYHGDVVRPSGTENLDVVTVGIREPWPGSLATAGAEELIEEFEVDYSYVVYDLGAVGQNPDIRRLLWRLDSVISVVAANTRKTDVVALSDLVRSAHSSFAGAVLNRYRTVGSFWIPVKDPELT